MAYIRGHHRPHDNPYHAPNQSANDVSQHHTAPGLMDGPSCGIDFGVGPLGIAPRGLGPNHVTTCCSRRRNRRGRVERPRPSTDHLAYRCVVDPSVDRPVGRPAFHRRHTPAVAADATNPRSRFRTARGVSPQIDGDLRFARTRAGYWVGRRVRMLSKACPRLGSGIGDADDRNARGAIATAEPRRSEPRPAHFQRRRGEGIEPSKRGAAPPCRF